jgi:xanthine dehydrogenase accessory factor
MIGVWKAVLDALDAQGRAAMVTLAAIRGSSPREAGARLIIRPDGSFTGTIGGGTLEWKAIALAQAALANPHASKAETRGFALGPELGQCCGGNVELIVEIIEGDRRPEIAALAEKEGTGALTTIGRLVSDRGVIREIATDAMPPGAAGYKAGVLTEGFGDDRRPIILFGAGHVGRALILALAPLPFRVIWVDPRPDAFPAYLPANVTIDGRADPVAALASAADDAFVLVMTHSHPLDLAICEAALRAGRFPYVGVIGSKSKRARFTSQLIRGGLSPARVATLVCPIGDSGVSGKAPAVIAAMTVAELLLRDEESRMSLDHAVESGGRA